MICFSQVFHNEARDYNAVIPKRGLFHVITYNVDSIPHRYLLQFSPFHVSDYVWGYTNSQSEKLSAAHHSARVFPLK